jgi:heat shock protein HtpX
MGEEPRLENLLEGVCVVGGIEEPAVRVLPDRTLNAAAVADSSSATFVVTRGLLDGLGRVELEGVLANLAARVKSGSARYATTALGLPVPASYGARLLEDGFGEQSSIRSDLAAVGLTKYPPGLIAALGVMDEHGTAVGEAAPRTAPLWLASPVEGTDGGDGSGVVAAPQPLALRIAVLEEL